VKRKTFSILFATVLAVSLCLVPVVASAVTYDSSLTLENKDTNWAIISDDISGTLDYNASGNNFNFSFTATGLTSGNYSLIYYADTEDRYVDWGGDNPGAFIATFAADSGGNISSGDMSVNLGMDLPCSPDANAYFYDYTQDPDNYDHATGAKIWLVPSADYDADACKLTAWNPDNYLFETDLIWYDDTNAGDSTVGLTAEVPDIVAISATPTSIDFGTVYPGQTAVGDNIVVTNVGTQTVDVDASATGSAMICTNLMLRNPPKDWSDWVVGTPWSNIVEGLVMGASDVVNTKLPVPGDYTPAGPEAATLIFEATAS